jgi:riboflavin synthase
MFTGIIEEIGKLKSIKPTSGGLTIQVKAKKVLEDSKIGDSIAINGICLTITDLRSNFFNFDVSQETINRTNIKDLKIGDFVNLERALRPIDRMGGHIVQGHVDTIGKITGITPKGEHFEFRIDYPAEYKAYTIEKGSIAIDGISLTINEIKNSSIFLNIIPHTIKNTNLQFRKVGDSVNIEFDIIGKYVLNIMKYGKTENNLENLLKNF